MERETGFEPATNSLEGCDSTPELLPPIPDPLIGGEWRIRTSVGQGPADLQSAAFDRSANSPLWLRVASCQLRVATRSPARNSQLGTRNSTGAGDGTRTRDLLITNQLLYQLSYASAELLDFKDTTSL